jgi:hypothetical protein
MLPAYNLIVDITSNDKDVSSTKFHEQVEHCINYLNSLSGALHRAPCGTTYYPPDVQTGKSEYWSVRAIVIISLGKKRAEHLVKLYEAIVRLIVLELPDFEVQAEISQMNFS